MRWFVIVGVVLSVISPAQPQKDKTTPEHMASFTQQQQNDIREAVFRYQFGHNASIQGNSVGVYCISVENKADPSDNFMKRFAGFKPPVHKASDCSTDAYKGVVEKATGKRGLVFWVKSINWISQTDAEVAGGYFEDGLSASHNTYIVSRAKEGRWRVSKEWMTRLS
jgi:hypothetical protein